VSCKAQPLSACARREASLDETLKRCERTRQFRQFCDNWTTRPGAVIILLLCLPVIVLIPSHLVGLPPILWTIPLGSVLLVTGFVAFRLFEPHDERLELNLKTWQSELQSLWADGSVCE
jgi:hypothetical protein